jgi:hypothetical protein
MKTQLKADDVGTRIERALLRAITRSHVRERAEKALRKDLVDLLREVEAAMRPGQG